MKETLALFDFDGTLTRHDSLLRFARFALSSRRFILGLFVSLPHIIAWKLGMLDNSKAKQHLFSSWFKGMDYTRFQQLGEAFSDKIDNDINPRGKELMLRHLNSGHHLAIVSASMRQWIEPWAMKNGFKDVIATEPEVDSENKLTGRFATPNCYGEEKMRRVHRHFSNYDRLITYAYSDSTADTPMLKGVCHGKII